MKYLKLFEARQTESEVAKICKRYGIKNWSLNSDGLIDVKGNVSFTFLPNLTKLPLNFGRVSGNFSCFEAELTSLEGCPRLVGGSFNCAFNKLTSLIGCPHTVGGSFNCKSNKLKDLEGCPEFINGYFECSENLLTSLKGGPKAVNGYFFIHTNKLKTFMWGPEEIQGDVYAYPNPLQDLPAAYHKKEWINFMAKEQHDWRLWDKEGKLRIDRLEQMIEWGIETGKISK
jgi:hypothetical protein